jgi:hypothetical protein
MLFALGTAAAGGTLWTTLAEQFLGYPSRGRHAAAGCGHIFESAVKRSSVWYVLFARAADRCSAAVASMYPWLVFSDE